MNDLSAHVAAPRPITLGGKTMLLHPLRMGDFKELETYLRGLPLAEIKSQMVGLDLEERKLLLSLAYEDAKDVRIGTDAFNTASQSFGGVLYMLWLALRRGDPTLTLEAVSEMLAQADFESVARAVNAAAGIEVSTDPTPPVSPAKP